MSTVLLVDSDPNFRRALAIALRLERFEVAEASSLYEARRRLASGSFDHALVDLLLPGADGLELAESLGRQHPKCRTIVCSAHPEAFRAARVRLPGVPQLDKPFTVEQFLRLLAVDATPEPALARVAGKER